MQIILLVLLTTAMACDCGQGICQDDHCYCLAPMAGKKCDYLIQYPNGMNHTHAFQEYVGYDTNQGNNITECVNDCNNNGICQESKCYCKSPHGGEYCQLKIEFVRSSALHTVNPYFANRTYLNFQEQDGGIDKKIIHQKCEEPCRNDGLCIFGQCMCLSPFVGDTCQYRIDFEYGTPHYQVVILSIFSCLLGIALILLIFILLKIRDDKRKQYELLTGVNKDEWKRN